MRTIALPYFILSCFLLLFLCFPLDAQYRTHFESSTTENEVFTKSEFHPNCNGTSGFYVGIRKRYNGDPGRDVIATGTINASGNTGGNIKLYPSNPGTQFVIGSNMAVTSIFSGGSCQGYVIAFSARTVTDFNSIYVLRYDLSGNIVWQKNPISSGTDQEFVGEVIQLDNGNIMIGGFKRNGPSGNVGTIIEMDLNGNTVNVNDLSINGLQNTEINDIIEVTVPLTSTKYAIVGKTNDQAFVSLVDATFTSNFTRIYNSGSGFNSAQNIIYDGASYFVQGQLNLGGTTGINILRLNAIPGSPNPEGEVLWDKIFWIDGENTFGRDMEAHPTGDGVVVQAIVDFFGNIDYDGQSRATVSHINSLGNEVWTTVVGGGFGENDQMLAGEIESDGTDLYISGSSWLINQGGNKRFWLAKFDQLGSLAFPCFNPGSLQEEFAQPNQDDVIPSYISSTFTNTTINLSTENDNISPGICQANPSGCGAINWNPSRLVNPVIGVLNPFIEVQDLTEETLQDYDISSYAVNWMFIDEQGIKQGMSNEANYAFLLPPFPQVYTIMQTVSFIAPNGEFCTMMEQEEYFYEPQDCNFAMVDAKIDFFGTDEEIMMMDMTMNPSMVMYERLWTVENPDGSTMNYSDENPTHPVTMSGQHSITLNISYTAPDGTLCTDFAVAFFIPSPCSSNQPINTFSKSEKVHLDVTADEFDIALEGVEIVPGQHVIAGVRNNSSNFEPEAYIQMLDNNGRTVINPISIKTQYYNVNISPIRPIILRPTFFEKQFTGYALIINLTNGVEMQPLLITFDKDLNKLCSQNMFEPLNQVIINDFVIGNKDEIVFVGEAGDSASKEMLIGHKDLFCDTKAEYKLFEKAQRGTSITRANEDSYGITGEFDDDIIFTVMKNNYSLVNLQGSGEFAFYDINNAGTLDKSQIIRFLSTNHFVIGGYYDNIDNKMYLLEVDQQGNVVNEKTVDHAGSQEQLRSLIELPNSDIAVISRVNLSQSPNADKTNLSLFDQSFNLKFSYNYANNNLDRTSPGEIYETQDGGLMTIGWGANTNDPWNFNYFDSHLTKTSYAGVTDSCACIEEDQVQVNNSNTPEQFYNEDNDLMELIVENVELECYKVEIEDNYCLGGIPIPNPCDAVSVIGSNMPSPADSCCVMTLDFSQTLNTATKIEITTSTPDLRFANVVLDPQLILDPIGSQSPQLITIQKVGGGAIPNINDYVSICFKSNSGLPSPVLQQLTIKYFDASGNIMDCTQIIEGECEYVDEPSSDCVELIDIKAECDPENPYLFKMSFKVKNNLPTTTLGNIAFTGLTPFGTFFSPSTHTITPLVAPNSTSTTQCIDIINSSGAPLPQLFDFTYFVYDTAQMQCCHDADTLSVVLPNCCSPCDTTWLTSNTIPTEADSCCHVIDLYNDCDFTLTKVQFRSLTTGVNFGNIIIPPTYSATWNANIISGSIVDLVPTGSTAPAGNYPGLMEFCLDNFDGNAPQTVLVHYIMNNSQGQDSIACTEVLTYECEDDRPCSEIVADSVYCDSNGNYFIDYCITNTSNPSFTATGIDIQSLNSSGISFAPGFVNLPTPINSGDTYCGTLSVLGAPPQPLAGDFIDLQFILHSANKDTCCLESDTLSIILPPCSDCCEDFDEFCNSVNFNTRIFGICDTAFVCVNNIDTCTYADIDWGDGTTDTQIGAFSVSHYYTTAGTYIVCSDFKESSDGGQTFCWNKQICDTILIEPCPVIIPPCDSIDYDESLYGTVAATCFSGANPTGYVLGTMDITLHQLAPIDNNWDATSSPSLTAYHGPAGQEWNLPNLGQVFGLAFDPDGNIYTATTLRYGPTTFGISSTPAIFKIDGGTGNISIFNNTLPQTVGQESGFGNICYNIYSDVLYTSNYEDGIIYAVDAKTSSPTYQSVISQFDFNTPDNGIPGLVAVGERVEGIGFNHVENRVYYYINLKQSTGVGALNEIRSVAVLADGTFDISSDRLETIVPVYTNFTYSYPGVDIAFSSDGQSMLLAEKSGPDLILWAHDSRTLEFKKIGLNWVAEPTNKFQTNIGDPYLENSAAGGTDYMYGDSLYMECDQVVLSTGDAIHYQWGLTGLPQTDYIYGFMGTPATGGNNTNSFLVDLDGNIGYDIDKSLVGDIEAYRNLCCGGTSTPDTTSCADLDWSLTDVTIDTMCSNGIWPDITIIPYSGIVIFDSISYDVSCDNTVELAGPPATIFTDQATGPSYSICVTFYKIVNGDTCDYQVIKNLELLPCEDITDPCEMLDWSTTTIDVDTTCIPGNLYPDITLTPQSGAVIFDWVDIDVSCDSSTDFTGGPGSNYVYSATNTVETICATFYKVIGNDTCDYSIQFEELTGECDTTTMMIDSCCIDQATNDARANQSLVTVASDGSTVTIDNPAMLECDSISATWAGMFSAHVGKSDLPFTITFAQDGVYPVSFIMISYDSNGDKCLGESIIYQDSISETKDYYLGDVQINPNPFQEYFSITMEQATDRELNLLIYDLTGKKAISQRLDQGQKVFSIATDGLVDGMYFVRIQDGAKILYVEKLIKM